MTLKEKIKNSFPKKVVFPQELAMLCDWSEENSARLRTQISGGFSLTVNDDAIKYWFGNENASDSLGVFANDYDGSLYAIWNNGKTQQIVFLGSEGSPLLILADNFIDFLRLLTIGYDEIGFSDLSKIPEKNCANAEFKTWVENTFNVAIPQSGDSITNINDLNFENWANEKLNNL